MTPTVMAGVIVATILAGAFAVLGFRKDYNENLRRRQLNKYRDRLRKLDNIILGLPPSYLPKTLKTLVYISITDSLEQIAKISGDQNYSDQIERVKQQLKQLQSDSEIPQTTSDHVDTTSLREYRHLLKELRALILDFHAEGLLGRRETETQVDQVNEILLAASLDFYCEAGRQSSNSDNKTLALHYYSMAKGQLEGSNSVKLAQSRLPQITERIDHLSRELEKDARQQEAAGVPDAAVIAEWDALEKEENKWQKKKYY